MPGDQKTVTKVFSSLLCDYQIDPQKYKDHLPPPAVHFKFSNLQHLILSIGDSNQNPMQYQPTSKLQNHPTELASHGRVSGVSSPPYSFPNASGESYKVSSRFVGKPWREGGYTECITKQINNGPPVQQIFPPCTVQWFSLVGRCPSQAAVSSYP